MGQHSETWHKNESPEERDIREGKRLYKGYSEIFGNRFIGADVFADAFPSLDESQLFLVTEAVQSHMYRSLAEKLSEGDIGVFLDRIRIGMDAPEELVESEREKWLQDNGGLAPEILKKFVLVYHPESTLSIPSLCEVDQRIREQTGNVKYIRYCSPEVLRKSWIRETLTPGWTLMTTTLEGSFDKTMDQQHKIADEFAKKLGLDPDQLTYPSPIDLVVNAHVLKQRGIPYLRDWIFERTTSPGEDEVPIGVGGLDDDTDGIVVIDDDVGAIARHGVSVFR